MITILKHDPKYDDIKFVIKAKAKDEIKPVFYNMYVDENGVASCTDGKRLHCAKETGLETGFYSVVKITKSEIILNKFETDIGTFPNIKQVIPDDASVVKTIEVSGRNLKLNGNAWGITDIIRAMDERNTVAINFVNDILGDDNELFKVKIFAMGVPVKFESGNKTAVIMPIIRKNSVF